MRKEMIAPLLVLLLLSAGGGYVLMNGYEISLDSSNEVDNEQNERDSDIYYVDTFDDLPACDSLTIGRLYFVAATAGFETCTSSGWAFLDLTSPAIPVGPTGPAGVDGINGVNGTDGTDGAPGAPGVNGTDGQNGANGQDGADGEKGDVGEKGDEGGIGPDGDKGDEGDPGTAGQDGADGLDGHTALAMTTPVPAGTTMYCTGDGIRIDVGVDDNDDGVLQANEVDQTQYVCDGVDGANGTAGVNGTNSSVSPNTMLTSISAPTLQACSSGGRIMQQGLDNGDGGGTAQNGVLESGEMDYTTTYCSNFVLTRMADVNGGSAGSSPGTYADPAVMGTRLYFDAWDGSSGRELWAHETTNSSIWQVADIYSGSGSGYPGTYAGLTVVGTRLYFDADDGSSGRELWAHETANSSTWRVADIASGTTSSLPGYFTGGLTVMGTRLYFDADDGNSGRELWVHEIQNGTTWLAADINSGSTGSWLGQLTGITTVGTTLYFSANEPISGTVLWAHDTSNETTWLAADIGNPGGGGSGAPFVGLTVMGTRLYFPADDGPTGSINSGYEPWAYETTNGSVWLVADISSWSSGQSSVPGWHAGFTVVGTRLYFDAEDSGSGNGQQDDRELWVHETTNDSTWQVADINSNRGSNPGMYAGVTVIGTRLYFDAYSNSGYELWAHETTNSSTWQVSNIYTGGGGSQWGGGGSEPGRRAGVTVMGTRLYFDAYDGSGGRELWTHEATNGSTWRVVDIYSGSGNGNPGYYAGLTVMGTRLYFDANDGSSGTELWRMEIEHTITYS